MDLLNQNHESPIVDENSISHKGDDSWHRSTSEESSTSGDESLSNSATIERLNSSNEDTDTTYADELRRERLELRRMESILEENDSKSEINSSTASTNSNDLDQESPGNKSSEDKMQQEEKDGRSELGMGAGGKCPPNTPTINSSCKSSPKERNEDLSVDSNPRTSEDQDNSKRISNKTLFVESQVPMLTKYYTENTSKIALNSERMTLLMEAIRNLTLSKQNLEKKILLQERQIREQLGLRKILDTTNEKLAKAEQYIRDLDHQLSISSQEIEIRETQEIKELNSLVEGLQSQVQSLTAENKSLKDIIEILKVEKDSLQQSVEEVTVENNEKDKTVSDLKLEIEKLKARESELEQQVEKLKHEKTIAVKAYQHLKQSQHSL